MWCIYTLSWSRCMIFSKVIQKRIVTKFPIYFSCWSCDQNKIPVYTLMLSIKSTQHCHRVIWTLLLADLSFHEWVSTNKPRQCNVMGHFEMFFFTNNKTFLCTSRDRWMEELNRCAMMMVLTCTLLFFAYKRFIGCFRCVLYEEDVIQRRDYLYKDTSI